MDSQRVHANPGCGCPWNSAPASLGVLVAVSEVSTELHIQVFLCKNTDPAPGVEAEGPARMVQVGLDAPTPACLSFPSSRVAEQHF